MAGRPACRLHRRHDLTSLGANHRKAKNAVVAHTDENLHEALCFVRRGRSQHILHRQPRNARGDALALRFASPSPTWARRDR